MIDFRTGKDRQDLHWRSYLDIPLAKGIATWIPESNIRRHKYRDSCTWSMNNWFNNLAFSRIIRRRHTRLINLISSRVRFVVPKEFQFRLTYGATHLHRLYLRCDSTARLMVFTWASRSCGFAIKPCYLQTHWFAASCDMTHVLTYNMLHSLGLAQ